MNQLFLFVLLILWGCVQNTKHPGTVIFPDMVYPVPFESFSKNPLTPDGKTMMGPVEGTISRGQSIFSYGTGLKEAKRAGRDLVNPLPFEKQILIRGEKGYVSYCLSCHGITGKGDGPLIPKFPNPPSFTTNRIMEYEDGHLYHVITKGAGDMESHGAQVLPQDRWAIVHYIRSLQGRKLTK